MKIDEIKKRAEGNIQLFSIRESRSKACLPSDLWGGKTKGYVLDCFCLSHLQYVTGYEVL